MPPHHLQPFQTPLGGITRADPLWEARGAPGDVTTGVFEALGAQKLTKTDFDIHVKICSGLPWVLLGPSRGPSGGVPGGSWGFFRSSGRLEAVLGDLAVLGATSLLAFLRP